MSTAENTIAVEDIQNELANSKMLSQLTNVEKREVYDTICPGAILPIDSPIKKAGDYLYGVDPNINGGSLFMGWKSKVDNPTSDNDFETPYGFSQ